MEAEIKEEFNKSGFKITDEDAILSKCLTFCTNYKLSPSDLVSSWEVYYLNRQLSESTLHNAEMDGFLLHLQNEQKEAFIKEETGLHAYSILDVDMILKDEPEDIKEDILDTQTQRPQYEELGGSGHGRNGSLVTPFGQRNNKFVVQFQTKTEPIEETREKESEDEDMGDEIIRQAQPKKRCSLVIHGSKPEPGCRYMYDRIEDRFNYLVNRIQKHTSGFLASGYYEEPSEYYEEPADPAITSKRSISAVGMICCDGEGRLDEKSILLQSSVEHSGGEQVRLDLENLSQYSIFPGQVVGVVGTNPSGSGHCLVASELVDAIPLLPSSDISLPPAKRLTLNEEGQYHCESPAVAELSVLQDHVEYMGSSTRVLLVPSIRDTNHDHVFPQPPFEVNPETKDQITSLTNPGIFDANGVKVACCTVDVIKHLSEEEIFRNTSEDHLGRFATHLINQRSFYPLYPPAESVPFDSSIAPEALNISFIPHMLILPSDLAPFVEVENVKCLCVNPGRLAKGIGGGTFVELYYCGSPETASASIIRI